MRTEYIRLVTTLFAVVTFGGCAVIAPVVRNARKWGCMALMLVAVAIAGDNIQHLHDPITVWILFRVLAMCCGVMYVARVMAETGWREHNRPRH